MKEVILNEIDKIKEEMIAISDYIYYNPELGDKEYKAAERLTKFLEDNCFKVKIGICNRSTAFKAVYDSGIQGPSIAYLCEYDALPEVGHGCGHNMIGTMSAGAAAALSKVLDKIGGRIIVLGTPAEETNGAKVDMAAQGIFDDVDVAMILHPDDKNYESGYSLAMEAIQFSFKGKSCHAASEPETGINALNAALLTFDGINALRQHLQSDVRIHGIIKEGGIAANIVPDKAVAQFYVRAKKKRYLKEVVDKVKNVARGAALMTGAELDISNYELSYDNMNTNKALSDTFNKNLKSTGTSEIYPSKTSYGSIDMGNVSNVVPAIHPYIGIGGAEILGHTKEMADLTITNAAHDAMTIGALALALTGYDVIVDKNLLENIKKEFEQTTTK